MATPTSGYIYFLGSKRFCWAKIGCSIKPKVRVQDIGILLPFKVELFAMWKAKSRFDAERSMHEKYSHRAINGEWFFVRQSEIPLIIATPIPFEGELVFNYQRPQSDISSFSNLTRDAESRDFRDMPEKKSVIDPLHFEKKEKFWAEVAAVYEEFGMEPTRGNRLAAIKIVENRRRQERQYAKLFCKNTTEQVAL